MWEERLQSKSRLKIELKVKNESRLQSKSRLKIESRLQIEQRIKIELQNNHNASLPCLLAHAMHSKLSELCSVNMVVQV